MTEPYFEIAREMIRAHEGVREFLYKDSLGIHTIGVGRNLERGLSPDEIEYLFGNDLEQAHSDASAYGYWGNLNDARKSALMDMAFQLGGPRLAGFKKMHACLEKGDYDGAALECLDSRYAAQVPARASTIAFIIRSGDMP